MNAETEIKNIIGLMDWVILNYQTESKEIIKAKIQEIQNILINDGEDYYMITHDEFYRMRKLING